MTNADLAKWFGLSEKTIRNTRTKKLEELSEYAEFENLRGKVKIIRILDPEKTIYIKRGSKNYEFTKKKTKELWSSDGLDTCSRVAQKLMNSIQKI